MHEYQATISWERGDTESPLHRYSRAHTWTFDGGLTVPASASPQIVRAPYSDPAAIDPEEAFVAALSSCHMLWFLDAAAQRGFRVTNYVDNAVGVMEKNGAGKVAITRVRLRPKATFAGEKLPTTEEIDALHRTAHEECFIANSVTSEVRCEPANTT
ncbi:MAG TPA: OsmC family protein [Burkholderiales bacterium]